MVLAVQLFNKIKRKEKKEKTKNMKKHVSLCFPRCVSRMLCRNTLMSLEVEIT